MAKKLFVGSLSWDTTDETLNEFFAQLGPVLSATVIKDKYNGRSKGFGFVEMENDEDAEKAKEQLNGQSLDGRTISITDARPQQPRENNNFSGGGGYRRDNRSGGGRGPRDNDRRR